MIDMGVGHKYVRHGLAAHGVQDGIDVFGLVGTGVDDRGVRIQAE